MDSNVYLLRVNLLNNISMHSHFIKRDILGKFEYFFGTKMALFCPFNPIPGGGKITHPYSLSVITHKRFFKQTLNFITFNIYIFTMFLQVLGSIIGKLLDI